MTPANPASANEGLQGLATFIVMIGIPIYIATEAGWKTGALTFVASFVASVVLGLGILAFTSEEEVAAGVLEVLGFVKLAVIGAVALFVTL